MTETEHTSTPWDFTRAGMVMASYLQGFAVYQANEANMICGVFSDVRGGDPVAEANAAFIVQACNAYDSDQRIIAELRGALKTIASDESMGEHRYKEIAGAALAKAWAS